jgi:hypothetical protein
VEAEFSAGESSGVVSVVVGAVVVPGAEEDSVGEVGATTSRPGAGGVVGLAPGGGDVAALGAAGDVAQRHGLALGGAVQAARAPEVEDLGAAAEHGRKYLGGAGQPACLSGRDRVVADQRERMAQLLVVGTQVAGSRTVS